MLNFHTLGVIGLAAGIAGCTTYPQPKDVTRKATISIVQRLRCEAKEALSLRIVELFLRSDVQSTKDKGRDLKELFETNKRQEFDREITELKEADYDPKTVERVQAIGGSSISYTFKFDITESNDNTADATFVFPFTNSIFTLGLKAGSELERKGVREFILSENLRTYQQLKCRNYNSTSGTIANSDKKNLFYPITGRIGIGDVFSTFIGLVRVMHPHLEDEYKLTRLGVTKGEVDSNGDGENDTVIEKFDPKKMGTYTDKITFTTRIFGSVTPKIELNPLSLNAGVVKKDRITASIISASERIDIHEVTITLGLFSPKAPPRVPKEIEVVLNKEKGVKLVFSFPKPPEIVEKVSPPDTPEKPEVEKTLLDSRSYLSGELESSLRAVAKRAEQDRNLDVLSERIDELRD